MKNNRAATKRNYSVELAAVREKEVSAFGFNDYPGIVHNVTMT